MDTDAIDALLERYLRLLHEYTTLREQLNVLQAGTYQNIARANFAAERGMRYGQDHYDERMQASRRVGVATSAAATADQNTVAVAAVPRFTVIRHGEEREEEDADSEKTSGTDEGSGLGGGLDIKERGNDNAAERVEERVEDEDDTKPANDKKKTKKKMQRDPLRWFGLLTPMALRQAQAQSLQAVEQVIPRLVSVDAEMAQVEIEVRRARKKRAKAEIAAAKERQQPQQQGSMKGEEITA